VTVAVQLEKWRTNQLAPRFLPSRRQFLFVLTGADPSVWLGSPDGAATGRITLMQVGADSAAEYLPPGWLVRVRQNVLEAQRFDVSGGKLSGYPVPLGCWNASDKHSNCGLQCPEHQQHHAACQQLPNR